MASRIQLFVIARLVFDCRFRNTVRTVLLTAHRTDPWREPEANQAIVRNGRCIPNEQTTPAGGWVVGHGGIRADGKWRPI